MKKSGNYEGMKMKRFFKEFCLINSKKKEIYMLLVAGLMIFIMIVASCQPTLIACANSTNESESFFNQTENHIDNSLKSNSMRHDTNDFEEESEMELGSYSNKDAMTVIDNGFFEKTKSKWLQTTGDIYVLYEDVTKRTERSKHFKMSDGSYTMVEYTDNVHYYNGSDFEEIDNTLIRTINNTFENKNNSFKVSFPRQYLDSSKTSVSYDGNDISFSLRNYKSKPLFEAIINSFINRKTIGKNNTYDIDIINDSEISYESGGNVDLSYQLKGNSLKENIIIKSRQSSYEFIFDINAKGLTLTKDNNGNIICTKGEDIKYIIPAGYMFDSANEQSEDVEYILEGNSPYYTLTIKPCEEWIDSQERVFPVTIDPIVYTPSVQTSIIGDCRAYIGRDNAMVLSSDSDCFYRFSDLNLPVGSTIINASLECTINNSYTVPHMVFLYELDKKLTKLKGPDAEPNIFYFNVDKTCDNPVYPMPDQQVLTQPGRLRYSFDVTRGIKNWIEYGKEHYGYALTLPTNNTTILKVATKMYEDGSMAPSITINYRQNIGIEEYWDYDIVSTTQDTIYINKYNNQMTVLHDDVTTGGVLPINLSHVYISAYNNSFYDVDDIFTPSFGYGWKLNYQQIIRKRGNNYEYYDADGTMHYFIFDSNKNYAYDIDGLGLKLYSFNNGIYKMTDGSNITYLFDYHGRLYKIEDANGNYVSITYGDGSQASVSDLNITKIQDSEGRNIVFRYGSDGLLSCIRTRRQDGQYVLTHYKYTNNLLTQIINPDGTCVEYTYSNNKLICIEDYLSHRVQLKPISISIVKTVTDNNEYSTEYYNYYGLRIEEGFRYASDKMTLINVFENLYFDGATISVTARENMPFVSLVIDENTNTLPLYLSVNLLNTSVFDNYGRIVSSYLIESEPSTVSQRQYISSDNALLNNKVASEQQYQSNSINYLKNGSFENNTNYWTLDSHESSVYSVINTSGRFSYVGNRALELFVAQPTNSTVKAQQAIQLSAGDYIFSGYVKVCDTILSNGADSYGAYLGVVVDSVVYESDRVFSDLFSVDKGFKYFSIGFSIKTTQDIVIFAAVENCYGFSYFDGLQLIRSSYGDATAINLIENGGFERTNGTIPQDWSTSYENRVSTSNQGQSVFSNNSMLIKGLLNDCINVYQLVMLPNITTATYYTLTAWINGMGKISWPKDTSNIGIEFYVDYPNGSDYYRLRFSNNTPYWHQESYCFEVKPGARSIQVYIQVRDTLSWLHIDNVSIVASQIISYDYDEFGKNVAYVDSNGGSYRYDENGDKIDIIKDGLSQYGVIKDSNGNILSSTDYNRSIRTTYSYDAEGRIVSETVSSLFGNKIIASSVSYSAIDSAFKRTISSIDALGFSTTSEYYAYEDIIRKTIFNDGSYVEYVYTYDSVKKNEIKTITVYNKDKSHNLLGAFTCEYYLSTEFSPYLFVEKGTNENYPFKSTGMLKKVTFGNGTCYSYAYDPYGNILTVSLNGVIQTQYYYRTIDNKLIAKRSANNYWEHYTYDSMGRLNSLRKSTAGDLENATLSYCWTYSISGNLIKAIDFESGITYDYQYDVNGRLILETRTDRNCRMADVLFEYKYDLYGALQERNIVDINRSSVDFQNLVTKDLNGDLTIVRDGNKERIYINGEEQIVLTYSTTDPETGYIIREDNKLLTSLDYPNGITRIYERNGKGKLLSTKCYAINNLSQQKNFYENTYDILSHAYEFDNGLVNIWDYDWMILNQPNRTDLVQKVEDVTYNGVDIKNIIKIHHKCFHSVENGLYSLVDPVALRSAPKGSTISFWAKISNINEFPTAQHIYVPNILYSDGTQSTLVEIEKIDQWQFFSIDVDPDKTPISMQMYWYNGVWLEIGNVFIHGEKQAFNVENAIDYSSPNYKSVACPAEKTNGQTISNIIKLRAPGYYLGTINGIETYKSIVDPSILMNGGDCIKLSYMARVDSLNDDWMQQLTESERNSRIYVLRFRYSDGTVDYGAKTSLLYNTEWQSFSVTSARGKVVVGVEVGYKYGEWIRIGNVKIECLNIGRMDGRVSNENLINGNHVEYSFDELGRQIGVKLFGNKGDLNEKLSETYSYLNGDENKTSYTITAKAIQWGATNGIVYNYTYCMDNPSLGSIKAQRANPYKIWQIKEGTNVKVTYNYDLLGRLKREDNAYINATITYEYDANNNITKKTTYNYTLGDLPIDDGISTVYAYDETFRDRLISYGGKSITYDVLGNPLTYLGASLTWQGRRLCSYSKGNLLVSYRYDMNGIRLSKTINGIKTEYLYDGTQLIREKTGDDTIWYLYDDVGIVGITVNGATYYYVRNYQGDVTKLLDVTGCVVVEYIYDSWGKVIETTGSLADTVGEKNPIRYRGYYYDTDTELYYLNSRYYDAETGRFISPDVQAEDGNLYTYCQDDPVNRSDESGYLSKFWKRIIKIAIGVVATVAAVAITVASGGAALPVVASVVASTVVGGGIRAANSAIQGGSREDILEAGIDGMCDGLMWGGLFVLGGSIVKAYASGNGLIKTVDPSYKPTNSFVSHGSTGRNMPQNLSEQLALKEAKSMPIQKWKILDKIEMGDARWLAKDGWVKVQYSAGKYGHIKIHATYNVYLDVFDDFKFIK